MEIYHPKDEELLREMRRVRRVRKRSRLLWGFVITLLLCVAAGWFLFQQYFTLTVMKGPGMGDTLPNGTLVLVRKNPPEALLRGDILLYSRDGREQLKRLIALPEDRVVLSPYAAEEIRVNGVAIAEPYVTGRAAETGLTSRRLTVEEGMLFLAGDQRSLSVDSRFRDYGLVPQENVIGRAEYVIWPFYRFRSLRQEQDALAGQPVPEAQEEITAEQEGAE